MSSLIRFAILVTQGCVASLLIVFCVFLFSLDRKLEGNKIPVAIVESRNIWKRFFIRYTKTWLINDNSPVSRKLVTYVSYRQSCVTCKFDSCLGISWHGSDESCSENLGVGCSSLWHGYISQSVSCSIINYGSIKFPLIHFKEH